MVILAVHLLSILAVGTLVAAIPAPALLPPVKSATLPHLSIAPTTTTLPGKTSLPAATGTSTAQPLTTGKISIPAAAIDAAPIVDKPKNPSLVSIPGGSDNSTLVQARPDLQTFVDHTIKTILPAAHSKRDPSMDSAPVAKRQQGTPNPSDCYNPAGLEIDNTSWLKLATKVCKQWYPSTASFEYDPSAPQPAYLKSSVIGPIKVLNGAIVHVEFAYGVDDYGTQAAYGWQKFYVPQSQSICIADLYTVIGDMGNACLFETGYDTRNDISASGAPKWYAFNAY